MFCNFRRINTKSNLDINGKQMITNIIVEMRKTGSIVTFIANHLNSITAKDDLLVVEAQVEPINIDQISPDQDARVRLPSFDQRTTPELNAKVETISADLLRDDATGVQYYKVRLKISEEEFDKLEGKSLVPGMPVETFIQTDERTVMSYLLKPIRDQISHAMRER